MELLDLIVYVAVGFIGGGCMGYALGANSPRRCVDCLSNDANRYEAGHRDGWRDGATTVLGRVRALSHEAKNTYTIIKSELERIENEAAEV